MTRLDIHLDKRDRQVDLASTLAERVRQGEVRAVARLITSLERREQEGRDTLRLLQGQGESSRAAIIGVTGYPGAGKSTIIDQLVTDRKSVV